MNTLLDQLNKDHGNVARLLDLVDYQLLKHQRGEPLDTSLLMKILRYLTQYQDVFHHPREDLVFAKIAMRSTEAAEALELLEAEHELLAQQGALIYRELAQVTRGADLDSDVATHLSDYTGILRIHMNQESSKIFPLATIVLYEEDWEDIDEALEIRADPLFGSAVESTYRSLVKHVRSRRERQSLK